MEDILKFYIEFISLIYPKQKSEEWIKNRRYTIGCSELFMACNTKKSKSNVIEKKLGNGYNLNTMPAIIFGNLFESSTKIFTEIKLNCNILDTPGSVLHPSLPVSCSPDGIGIVKIPIKQILQHIKNYNCNQFKARKDYIKLYNKIKEGKYKVDIICLFEFKSPYTRKVDKIIKIEYLYQVLGGLSVIDLCYLGIFVECEFRLCSINMFNFNDQCIHIKSGENDSDYIGSKPNAIGIKLLISDNIFLKQLYHNEFEEININTFCSEIDINRIKYYNYGSDYYELDVFMISFQLEPDKYSYRINPEYIKQFPDVDIKEDLDKYINILNSDPGFDFINSELYDNELLEITNSIIQKIKNKNVFGIMYFKLFGYNMFYVNKIDDFLETKKIHFDEIFEEVNARSIL